jgi:hydroxypyruvate isomerase
MDLFTQASAIPDLGSAAATGWGAFCLAVAVLYWIAFHHLPSKDKQQTEMLDKHGAAMEKKDAQVMQVIRDSHAEGERQRVSFTNNLEMVVAHCKEENAALLDKMRRESK